MTLIKEGIITAAILILIGIVGFVAGNFEKTALIPAIIGILILISALIAIKNLKIGMHLAALFGLLGTIAPLGRLIPVTIKQGFSLNLPTISILLTVLTCGIFLFLCIQSFIKVRKERNKAG